MEELLKKMLTNRQKYLSTLKNVFNVSIVGSTIYFDTPYSKNVEDCRLLIVGREVKLSIVGTEGIEDLYFDLDDNINQIKKRIEKVATYMDCKGLKE